MTGGAGRPVGLTRDAGWQIGVSRTVAAHPDRVWELLTSPTGVGIWLGTGVELPLRAGEGYRTDELVVGEVRSHRPGDRIRLTWQPPDRPEPATVQVTVRPAARGATVGFHTERLRDSTEREAMRDHWRRVLDAVESALDAPVPD